MGAVCGWHVGSCVSGSKRPCCRFGYRGNGWCLITCWDVVWIEAVLLTVCLSSWWGNYSLQPGSYSLDLHVEVFTCSRVSLQVQIMQWKKFPLIRSDVGLFSLLPGGGGVFWTSNSHIRNILIAFDNNTPQYRWITGADAAPPDCKDNHVSSSAVCFQSWVMVIFCAGVCLRSKPLTWDQTAYTSVCFWCLCVRMCVCGGKGGRCRAGRIMWLPLITHRWLILGLRVWRCPSIHHFLFCTHTHTQSYTNTIPVLGVAISWQSSCYCPGAQLWVVES